MAGRKLTEPEPHDVHAGCRARKPPVSVMGRIRAAVRAVRPVDPEFAAVVARRWAGLPQTTRAPCQVLGRHRAGGEGTRGDFPAATWPARPVTTPATPTGCGSTARTPWRWAGNGVRPMTEPAGPRSVKRCHSRRPRGSRQRLAAG